MPSPFQEGDEINVVVERLAYGGKGVAHPNGFTIFIPRSAPGDEMKVRIQEVRKRYAQAHPIQLITPSPYRISPECRYYQRCGGCHDQHLQPQYSSQQKVLNLSDSLERIGPGPISLLPLIQPKNEWGYRNKLTFHRSGSGAQGYVTWDDFEILDIETCPIAEEKLNQLWIEVRKKLADFSPKEFPYVVLRQTTTGQLSLLLSTILSLKDSVLNKIRKTFENENLSLWASQIQEGSRTPFGEESHHLSGSAELIEKVGDVSYSLRPDLFFQVHPEITSEVVKNVRVWAVSKTSPILDLYCGAGLFSLAIAREGIKTYGVEMNHLAIQSANSSAEKNGLASLATFRAGKTETILRRLIRDQFKFETALVDPPRKGLQPQVIEMLLTLGIKNLLYVSCSPPTMARDLKALVLNGFEIESIQPYDMFPKTYHLEAVTKLRKKV